MLAEQEYPEEEEPEEYEEEFTEEPVREPAVTIQEDDVTEEEPTSEKAEAGDREVVSEEEQVSEDEAIYETAAADEDIRARFHEAQAQENLLREKCQNYLLQLWKKIFRKMKWHRQELLQISERFAKVRFTQAPTI